MTEKAKCIIGEYCQRHGFIHGGEAEELRQRIEGLMTGRLRVGVDMLRHELEEVDARDSLAYLERKVAE